MSVIRPSEFVVLSGCLSYECKTGNETDQSNACYTAMSPDTMNSFTWDKQPEIDCMHAYKKAVTCVIEVDRLNQHVLYVCNRRRLCFHVLCMHTRRQYVACVIGVNWLKLHAHTHFVDM